MSVAPPSSGLGSNFNYFLASGGNAITGLNVEITFDEPLISTANGLGFQLNTYARANSHVLVEELENAPATTPTWQQYVIVVSPDDPTINGVVDNWDGTVPGGDAGQIINQMQQITTLDTPNQIPAGATINFTPVFDANSVLTGITYVYTPPGGQAIATTLTLTDLNLYNSDQKVDATYESPIAALTLNIVGDYNGNAGTFSSGSGSIVYTADQPLTVLSTEPDYTSFQDGTGETGNTVYGELPESDATSITQTWGIGASSEPNGRPAVGHKLPIPSKWA